jgi:hypothetical protein
MRKTIRYIVRVWQFQKGEWSWIIYRVESGRRETWIDRGEVHTNPVSARRAANRVLRELDTNP